MPQPPDPSHGEVTVRTRAVGVCGSDLHWYQDGRIGEIPAAFPQVLGHEPAGDVIAIGAGVHDFALGDRVVLEPTISCGHCEYCIRGQHNHCAHGVFLGGPQAPGMFRDYITLPAGNCTLVPSTLDYRTASLIEPIAVMMHMLELITIRTGDVVVVTGAGPIGMLCAAIAKASGAGSVIIADRLAYRLKLAMPMGADVAIDTTAKSLLETVADATHGRGADVVLEASGSSEMVNAAIRCARMSGIVMLIGLLNELNPRIDIQTAMGKELRLQTLKRSNHRAQAALAMLQSGKIPTSLITHTLPLAETPRAFKCSTHIRTTSAKPSSNSKGTGGEPLLLVAAHWGSTP